MIQKKNGLTYIGGNNIVAIYFDNKSLPSHYKDVRDLDKKGVVYKIEIKGKNKIYIGSTFDFNERMGTHAKDGRSKNDNLHFDMRENGSFIVTVIGVYDTILEARQQEKKFIKEYQNKYVKKVFGVRRFLESQESIEEILKTKMYNAKLI